MRKCKECGEESKQILDNGFCLDCMDKQTRKEEAILRAHGVSEEEIKDTTRVGKGEMSVEEWIERYKQEMK